VLDGANNPIVAFVMDERDVAAVRWVPNSFQFIGPNPLAPRLNLTIADASRVRAARAGNTFVMAWIENAGIAVRRMDLTTGVLDAGAFVTGIVNPSEIDLAVDSSGRAVIAYAAGPLATRLQVIRETGPGAWAAVGGDVASGPLVLQFGLHVDDTGVIRIVWIDDDVNYRLSLAQFDGAAWAPLPGRPTFLFAQSGPALRALSVNPHSAMFAFAYAMDADMERSLVTVQQLTAAGLADVGAAFQVDRQRVGHLSLAMPTPERATMAQSELTAAHASNPYKLVIRRLGPNPGPPPP
jgi:hypothetical protein